VAVADGWVVGGTEVGGTGVGGTVRPLAQPAIKNEIAMVIFARPENAFLISASFQPAKLMSAPIPNP
jgi:hypothetical protein